LGDATGAERDATRDANALIAGQNAGLDGQGRGYRSRASAFVITEIKVRPPATPSHRWPGSLWVVVGIPGRGLTDSGRAVS
jgi:hypothetical protein